MMSTSNLSYTTPVALSFLFFIILNVLLKTKLSLSEQLSSQKKWLFRNTVISLIHSSIVAVWSIYCFIEEPAMVRNLFGDWSKLSYYLAAFFVGYSLHDTVDILLSDPKSVGLIIHHVVVIADGVLALHTHMYLSVVTFLLLMEINSIFLHFRRILRIYGITETNFIYRVNLVLLFTSFVAFRFIALVFLAGYFVVKRRSILLLHFTLGLTGVIALSLTNVVLFQRLWRTEISQISKQDKNKTVDKRLE